MCPECGRELDRAMLAAARARAALEVRLPAIVLRHLLVWGVVIVVYAVGAGVVTRSVVQGAASLAMLGVGVAGTMLLGWGAVRLGHPWERAMLLSAWLKTLPWLHGPWLMIAPATAVIMLIALIDRWSYADGILVATMIAVGLLLWIIGVAGCLAGGVMTWGREVRRQSLPDAGGPTALAMLAIALLFPIVIGGGAVVGLMGGAAAADSAMKLVPSAWIDD